MKTIYYSELLKKEFETAEACQVAEEAAQKQEAKNAQEEKKQFANAVEVADEKVENAYKDLEIAKEKVREMYATSEKEIAKLIDQRNTEMQNILDPAKKAVRDAEEARYKAIAEYNKHCGVYKKYYTGNKAIEEFSRAFNNISDLTLNLLGF